MHLAPRPGKGEGNVLAEADLGHITFDYQSFETARARGRAVHLLD